MLPLTAGGMDRLLNLQSREALMSYWTDLRTPTELELVVGFYDLVGYTRFSERTDAMRLLEVMTGFTALVGKIIQDAGGVFIKPIGDAGLFAFQGDQAGLAVETSDILLTESEAWLGAEGYPNTSRLGLHAGPVAVGRIGAPGNERLDIIGKTVNTGARLVTHRMTVTPAVFRKLSLENRKRFKKHTPPVSYIGVDDPRPRDYRREYVSDVLPQS